MNILITGGAGFIGSILSIKLSHSNNVTVIDCFDRNAHNNPDAAIDNLQKHGVQVIKANLNDIESIHSIPEPDLIYHLAAKTGTGESMYKQSLYIQENVLSTARLLDYARQAHWAPKRIILTSSRAVYGDGLWTDGVDRINLTRRIEDLKRGIWEPNINTVPYSFIPNSTTQPTNPISLYGMTKLWQESLLISYCESTTCSPFILRLQNVYGPGQQIKNPYTGIIGIFCSMILANEEVELFEDGNISRDFVYIDDVVDSLIIYSDLNKLLPKYIDIGTGESTTLINLINIIADLCLKSTTYSLSSKFRIGDVRCAYADTSILDSLGILRGFKSLEYGLSEYLKWLLNSELLTHDELNSSLKEMESAGFLISARSTK